MWVALSLLAALGSAGTSLVLKRLVVTGGAMLSTVLFRVVASLMLGLGVTLFGAWPALTPELWRTLAMVIPPEVGGMVCLSLALRTGEVSLVQPMMGLIPLLSMIGGAIFLNEQPSGLAAVGVVLVALGLYWVGLRKGASALEPFRALASSRESWLAVAAAVCWSVTTLLHKVGIALVGPIPWSATLTLSSALTLACALPVVAWRTGSVGWPQRVVPWTRLVVLAALCFATQQVGLHNAFRLAPVGYVISVASVSILIATAVGVLRFGEQGGGHRIIGALLVSGGAAMIALFG